MTWNMKPTAGFTLIELMIAVVIVAILAAIVVPAYSGYIVRGKLTDATTALAELNARMEQFLADNRNYGTTAAACPAAVVMPVSPTFSFSCTWGDTNANTSYRITATGNAGQGLGAVDDYRYTLAKNVSTAAPTRATVKFAGSTVNLACWITKQGQGC